MTEKTCAVPNECHEHKRLLDNGEPAPLHEDRCHGYATPEADALSMETAQLSRDAIAREAEAVLADPPHLSRE